MNQEQIQKFSDRDKEFVSLLIDIGVKKPFAMVLVYLLKNQETTARAIELGTELNQADISYALKELMVRGWITFREVPLKKAGQQESIHLPCQSHRFWTLSGKRM